MKEQDYTEENPNGGEGPFYTASSLQLSINLGFNNGFIDAVSIIGTPLDDLIIGSYGHGSETVLGTMSSNSLLANDEPTNGDSTRGLRGYDTKRHPENESISDPYQVNKSLREDSRRQLSEYNPDSDPEYDPFSTHFHGYQDSSVEVQQWMVDLLKELYNIRLEQGVAKPLCFNEFLMIAAQKHIDDIVEQNLTLSHIGSDNTNGIERITREGYQYESYGATITKTGCIDVQCALVNRPLYFSKQGKFQHLGIAREENHTIDDPQWYWVFGESDVDVCMGTNETALEWPVGTPTLPPDMPELEIPLIEPDDGGDLIDDWMIGLLSLMNAERMHAGVPNLCFNWKLTIAAQIHNQDMVDNDFFSHTGSNGTTPSIRATALGYDSFDFISENIAWITMPSIKEALYTWMSSEGIHGSNILDPQADHVGFAFDEETRKYTAVFGGYTNDDEKCISGIACGNTESTVTLDPDWDLHTCSYCFKHHPITDTGVMGNGFGSEWYLDGKNDLESYIRRA